jgi:hypothetical protein
MSRVSAFFEDLDRAWGKSLSARIPLRIIGSSALTLQVDYDRGTKDIDVLRTLELTTEIADRLVALAGRGAALHTSHRLFLELVPNGLPFLALDPIWNHLDALAGLLNFEVKALDVVDVVVSKLIRFHSDDVDDIQAMIDRGLVSHTRLLERFRAAFDYAITANPSALLRCVEHLNRVERDLLAVDETAFEMPSWI